MFVVVVVVEIEITTVVIEVSTSEPGAATSLQGSISREVPEVSLGERTTTTTISPYKQSIHSKHRQDASKKARTKSCLLYARRNIHNTSLPLINDSKEHILRPTNRRRNMEELREQDTTAREAS